MTEQDTPEQPDDDTDWWIEIAARDLLDRLAQLRKD